MNLTWHEGDWVKMKICVRWPVQIRVETLKAVFQRNSQIALPTSWVIGKRPWNF